jgi:hypothetical protein
MGPEMSEARPSTGPRAQDRGLLIACGCASVLLMVPLLIPLATGQVFTQDDLGCFHLPLRSLYANALSAGDSLLWSSALFSGFYVHGEGQVGILHPWHLLLYRLLSLQTAFNVELIASYPAALAGMGFFLRRIGLDAGPSLFGALIFAFSGFNLLHLHHMNAVAIVAHIPWLLLSVEHAMAGDTPRVRALGSAGVALLVGSEILLGYPQYVWMSGLIVGGYTMLRAVALRTVRGPGRVVAFALLGLAIGCVQLIPTIEASTDSIRAAAPLEFSLSYSMHPLNLLQLWSPHAFPFRIYSSQAEFQVHEFGIYNGAFCTVALFWVGARWRALRHRAAALAAAGLCVIGVVLALGRYGIVYNLLAQVPVFSRFRVPARHIMLVHFGMAILSAVAIDDVIAFARRRDRMPFGVVAALGAPIVLSILAGLIAAQFPQDALGLPSQPTWLRLTVGAALMGAAARLIVLSSRGARPALWILPLFVAFDLGPWGYDYMWTTPPRTIAELAASVEVPDTVPAGSRISAPLVTDICDAALLRDYSVVPGYAGLPPARVISYFDETALRLSGVSWLRVKDAWAPMDPMPRARLVTDVRVSSDIARDVSTIELSKTALVSEELPAIDGPAGSAAMVEDRPGRMVIEVSAPRRNLLVTTEAYHAGWRAADDEGAIRVVRAYGDYLAAVIEPGTRQIVLTFDPRSTRIGALISAAGLVLTAVLALLLLRSA